jgi:phospholipid/cholesterol/gamma-HCH transport system permease protein
VTENRFQPFHWIGASFLRLCRVVGEMLRLFVESTAFLRQAHRNPRSIVKQMARIGADTLPIGALMSLFIGMVLALQSGYALQKYGTQGKHLGPIVALSIVRELGPVLMSLLVAGRIGSAIAAEIGTMAISEEIDALVTLRINPIRFLAMPRLIAALVMLPVLVVYADVLGILGGGVVAHTYFEVPYNTYFDQVYNSLDFGEILRGLVKATFFGGIIATVGCHRGFRATGGAEGVGQATIDAVVYSFIGIFISNYFITRLYL